MFQGKKLRTYQERSDLFDGLPDDIILSILCKLSSTSSCPSDFISILITCKRLNGLGLHPLVLSKSGSRIFSIRSRNWSEQAHRFLKRCVDAGSIEACYALGMIRFYCLQNPRSGASLMAKAAIRSHTQALYSLAVIQFNGSGGSNTKRYPLAGVVFCRRAAYLGHIDALRELGHCVQDGYGVRRNVAVGQRLLAQANAREIASFLRAASTRSNDHHTLTWQLRNKALPSDFGYNVPSEETHPVNRFLAEWFEYLNSDSGKGIRLCSHTGCGRPETRKNEFRRCSACETVNYCSRACQSQDWKVRHKSECTPPDQMINLDAGDGSDGDGDGDDDDQMAEVDGASG